MATILLNEGTTIKVAETKQEIKEKIIAEREAGEPNANYITLKATIVTASEKDFASVFTKTEEIELNSKRILYFY